MVFLLNSNELSMLSYQETSERLICLCG